MPEIKPIMPEGAITIQARTQMPSAALKKAWDEVKGNPPSPSPAENQTPTETTPQTTSEKPKPDEKVLRARLVQERLKRQIEAERKTLNEERRQLDLEKANSRKWQEAAELAQSGRYIEAAQKAGLSYDQLTQQIINGGQIPPQQIAQDTAAEIVKREMAAFREEQKTQSTLAQQQQYEQTIKQMTTDVKHLIDSSDKYPLAKQSESYQDIVKFIESEFHRTGRITPVEEALKRWEQDALEGLEELFKLENVRNSVLKESPAKPKEELITTTLSQRATAPIPQPKSLTDAERKERAMKAFYGRLP